MSTVSLAANENSLLCCYRTEIGRYTVDTSRLPRGGFETIVIEAPPADGKQTRTHRPARCFWERDARKNHNAAVTVARRLDFLESTRVGEILVSRWGQDDANIDFFVVVDVGPSSIKIQECGKTALPTANDLVRQVVPNAQERIGKPIVKRGERHQQGFLAGWNGKPTYERRCA